MEGISVRVLHSLDHPSPHPQFTATMSALPLEKRAMALFHRGPHHTEPIAKEKLFRCTRIPRTLAERVETDLSYLGGLEGPIAGACCEYAHLDLLILTVLFRLWRQVGSLDLRGDSEDVTDPGSTFQAAF